MYLYIYLYICIFRFLFFMSCLGRDLVTSLMVQGSLSSAPQIRQFNQPLRKTVTLRVYILSKLMKDLA